MLHGIHMDRENEAMQLLDQVGPADNSLNRRD